MKKLNFPRILLASIFAFTLAGCGQTGALYIPQDSQMSQEQTPQDAPSDSVTIHGDGTVTTNSSEAEQTN